jgi:hypothetical protein
MGLKETGTTGKIPPGTFPLILSKQTLEILSAGIFPFRLRNAKRQGDPSCLEIFRYGISDEPPCFTSPRQRSRNKGENKEKHCDVPGFANEKASFHPSLSPHFPNIQDDG